jgi:recombination associated protein RdgC
MFKQLKLYRIGAEWPATAAQLAEALAQEPFTPCTATQQRSTGWVPPRGEAHGALVEVVDGQWIARFAIETKAVPGDAVRQHADAAAAEIEKATGRRPGKREMRDLRDDALQALLPAAFPRISHITAWVDRERGWLVLDTCTASKADELVTSLVRVAGKGFTIGLLQTAQTPQAVMAGWLAAESAAALPDAFHVERDCELKGSGDEPPVIKISRHTLDTEEVRQHLAEGKLPTRLALGWQGRVGFTLTHTLDLRKLTWMEGVFEKANSNTDDDRFDADVALLTGELSGLLRDLIDALGGEVEP